MFRQDLGVLGKSISIANLDTEHIKDEGTAPDGASQIGDRKMKKIIFAIAMSVGFASGALAQNSWHGQTDSFGNTYCN